MWLSETLIQLWENRWDDVKFDKMPKVDLKVINVKKKIKKK